jgi:hypothetical protein
MISHEHKCIFIHIPKTAGTSISYKLGLFKELKRGVQDHRTIRTIEPPSLLDVKRLAIKGDIRPLAGYIINIFNGKKFVSPNQYKTYFKFTFVRNSWARVFSRYKKVMTDNLHKKSLGVSDDCTFKEFLNNHLNQWALKPQLYWITDKRGKIPMDFIGRYEKLEEDFSHVCNVLGIKDASLPRLLSGDDLHYTQFYDEEMKDIIARKYSEEIAFFKFEFGE